MKKLIIIKVVVLVVLVSIVTTSCSSSRKYGCGGGVNPRMTWDRMVDHINRP